MPPPQGTRHHPADLFCLDDTPKNTPKIYGLYRITLNFPGQQKTRFPRSEAGRWTSSDVSEL